MPILGSFGTANDRAYGFSNSDFMGATELPLIITNNAQIIYDASNPDSYSGSGSTWYDISGNNRHATLNGTPTLSGTGANQYFIFTDTNTVVVPSVFDTPAVGGEINFVYYFVADLTQTNSILSTDTWGTALDISTSEIYFTSKYGSGGGSRTEPYDPSGWKLFRVAVRGTYTDNYYFFSSSTSCGTTLGGQTGSATGGADTPTNGKRTYSSFTAKNGAVLKFISLYSLANDPGLTSVYNALKGRFGL